MCFVNGFWSKVNIPYLTSRELIASDVVILNDNLGFIRKCYGVNMCTERNICKLCEQLTDLFVFTLWKWVSMYICGSVSMTEVRVYTSCWFSHGTLCFCHEWFSIEVFGNTMMPSFVLNECKNYFVFCVSLDFTLIIPMLKFNV